MFFRDVVGLQDTKQRLIDLVANNRLAHTTLWHSSPENYFSIPLVLAFIQYVLCEDKQANDSCGVCRACVKQKGLVHPDVSYVFPVNTNQQVKKNPLSQHYIESWRDIVLNQTYFGYEEWMEFIGCTDKQGLISVSESESILGNLSLKSYESAYKIVFIWLPEKMHISAANKLLKVIEEPPDNCFFFMLSNQTERVISTITSRSQLVEIPMNQTEAVRDYLVQTFSISSDQAASYISSSGTNLGRIIKQIEQSDDLNYYTEEFKKWMRLCYSRNSGDIISWTEATARKDKTAQRGLLQYAITMIRECLLITLVPDQQPSMALMEEEHNFASKFAPFINENNATQIYDLLVGAINDLERNANAKILFLDITLKLGHLLNSK